MWYRWLWLWCPRTRPCPLSEEPQLVAYHMSLHYLVSLHSLPAVHLWVEIPYPVSDLHINMCTMPPAGGLVIHLISLPTPTPRADCARHVLQHVRVESESNMRSQVPQWLGVVARVALDLSCGWVELDTLHTPTRKLKALIVWLLRNHCSNIYPRVPPFFCLLYTLQFIAAS